MNNRLGHSDEQQTGGALIDLHAGNVSGGPKILVNWLNHRSMIRHEPDAAEIRVDLRAHHVVARDRDFALERVDAVERQHPNQIAWKRNVRDPPAAASESNRLETERS